MSAQEIAERIRQLPPDELRRFAAWWERFRESALLPEPAADSSVPPAESKAVTQELLARQREYFEHPERFVSMDEKGMLDERWVAFLKNPAAALTLEQFKEKLKTLRA